MTIYLLWTFGIIAGLFLFMTTIAGISMYIDRNKDWDH